MRYHSTEPCILWNKEKTVCHASRVACHRSLTSSSQRLSRDSSFMQNREVKLEEIRLLASLQASQRSHILVFKFSSLCMHGNSVCDRNHFNLSNSTGTFYTIPLFTRFRYLWHSSSRTVDWTFTAGPVTFPWFPEWNQSSRLLTQLFRKQSWMIKNINFFYM